jgi:hypothetical protein
MSSPPLRVFLTQNQEESLFELSKSTTVPQRTRDRASAIRLSSLGWKVDKIAIYLKWQPADLAEIEYKLDKEQRTYNSHQLGQFLAKERKIQLSERHLRRILKKKLSMEKN